MPWKCTKIASEALEVVRPIEHVRDELGHERHVGVVAEERLLQQVDGFLREVAVPCKFRAAGLVLVAEHFQAARASAVVERAHLRAGNECVTLVSEDNVELLADRFVDHVDVHPGAARKQDDFLPFFLELEPVQVRIQRVHAVFQLLAHVGVHHSNDAVHQDLHLSRHTEQVQGKTPDDNVGVRELFAHPGHVVILHEAAAVFASPAAEASAAWLNVQAVDKKVFTLVVAVFFEPLHEGLCRNQGSAAFVFRTCDHYENFLLICHAYKFRKKYFFHKSFY